MSTDEDDGGSERSSEELGQRSGKGVEALSKVLRGDRDEKE